MNIKNTLGYKLGASSRIMKRKMDLLLAPYDITTSQWAVIKLLQEKGELTQKQIADELLGDKVTVGEIISKLQKRGYISITVSPNDKRAHLVKLTENSMDIIQDVEDKADTICKEVLAGMSENEIDALNRAFEIIMSKYE